MLYRHRHFRLDTDSESVFDENGKPLAFTKHLFRALRALCEYENIDTDELGDLINGGESDHFYNHNTIRQYRYRINKLIGYDVVRYEKQRFFLDERVVTDDRSGISDDGTDTDDGVTVPRSRFSWRMIVLVGIAVVAAAVGGAFVFRSRPDSQAASPIGPETPVIRTESDMVSVPAGEFLMGSTDAQVNDAHRSDTAGYDRSAYLIEYPQRTVFLPSFHIDRKEVSNADYRMFADAMGKDVPEASKSQNLNAPNQPVVGVDWAEADAYCRWVGKRLPTEAEWEKAARGTDGRIFPWGNEWKDDRDDHIGNQDFEATAPVDTELGISPYGALNMAGNVYEWVNDDLGLYPGNEKSLPYRLNGSAKLMRGGGYADGTVQHRTSWRLAYPKDFRDLDLGFRCAKDAD